MKPLLGDKCTSARVLDFKISLKHEDNDSADQELAK